MPLTPYHMGPGILAKALLRGSFSLVVYGWTQIIMDVQPLIADVTHEGPYHGFTHTYVGATLLGAGAAVTGKYIVDAGSYLLPHSWRPRERTRWRVAFLSAFIGSYGHVVLDSFVPTDVRPWWPLSASNQLFGLVPEGPLLAFCVWTAVIGAVWYVTVLVAHALAARRRRTRESPEGR